MRTTSESPAAWPILRQLPWLPGMLALVVLAQFWRWVPGVFYGDDLSNLLAFREGALAGSLWQAWTESYLDKYRPVFATALGACFAVFDDSFNGYAALNVALHAVNACLAAGICLQVSGGQRWIAVAAGVSVAACRFALYQVTQVTGLLEGLGFLFFLLALGCVLGTKTGSPTVVQAGRSEVTRLWLAVLWCACAVFTHERYLALALWLCLVFAFAPPIALDFRTRAGLVTSSIGIAVANFGIKALLQSNVLVGTGGQQLGLNLERTLANLTQAFATLAGFNTGPDYLVGTVVSFDNPEAALALGVLFATSTAAALALAMVGRPRAWHARLWLPVSLGALSVLMVMPPALTIRMEQRWLVQPACLLVVALAGACRQADTDDSAVRLRRAAAGLALACGLALDVLLSFGFPKIFLVYSAQFAQDTRAALSRLQADDTRPWALVSAQEHCDWTLLEGRFFELYGPRPRTVTCIDDALEPVTPDTRVMLRVEGEGMRDVTDLRNRIQARRAEPVLFDFVGHFDEGQISDPRPVETPSGHGALRQTFDLPLEARSSVTVVSGFSYTFPSIQIPTGGAVLRFDIAMPFPAPAPARAEVQVQTGTTAPAMLWSRLMQPRPPAGPMAPESVEIDLSAFAGKAVRLSFATRTPGDDDRGHWIAWISPRVVATSP